MKARQYQLQLLERAKAGNVIACIDTGSGKTLIAAMLLEHMHALQRAEATQPSGELDGYVEKRPKLSLFLVNLVPLVHQQASFLDANTSLKIRVLYGEVTHDTLTEAHWNKIVQVSSALRQVLHRRR